MANEWNVSYPIDHTKIGDVPGEVRKLKDSCKDQLDHEHETPVDGDATGSEHSSGSAVAYEGSSAPTTRPGGASLANNAIDRGRLWIDDNFDPPRLTRWDGSAVEGIQTIAGGASPVQAFLISTTSEDSDGGREVQLRAKGSQSGDELTTLGFLEFAHEGAADDQKGRFRVVLNDGDDNDAPSKALLELIPTGIDVANSLAVLDEDDMAADSAIQLATQQSIKAYAQESIIGNAAISVFGARTRNDTTPAALAKDVTYKAQCDGLLNVWQVAIGNSYKIEVFVDATQGNVEGEGAAYLVAWRVGSSTGGGGYSTLSAIVRKNDYIRIGDGGTAADILALWQPLGTGGLVDQT